MKFASIRTWNARRPLSKYLGSSSDIIAGLATYYRGPNGILLAVVIAIGYV